MNSVAVIGAGIAGLSTAWALTKRDIPVTLYEQAPAIPNPLSASGDEHRIIRRAYGHQSGYAKRIDEAYAAWESMFEDIGVNHLISNGFLIISREPSDEAEQYRDGLLAGGYPLELMNADEAATRYAFLQEGTFRYAGFGPEGGALMCQRIANDLVAWLGKRGVDIQTGCQATGLDAETGAVSVDGKQSKIHDQIIVTAGAWILKLMPELAQSLTTYRTAVCYLTPPDDLNTAWRDAPVILDVGGQSDGYAIPPLFGSGLKLGSGRHKIASAPDADRVPAAKEHHEIMRWFAPPLARLDEYRHEKTVTCAYTFTSDERFFAANTGKITAISACSGHGYKFGAAIGERVAQAVTSSNFTELKQWLAARD